jgi:hypothetical protein
MNDWLAVRGAAREHAPLTDSSSRDDFALPFGKLRSRRRRSAVTTASADHELGTEKFSRPASIGESTGMPSTILTCFRPTSSRGLDELPDACRCRRGLGSEDNRRRTASHVRRLTTPPAGRPGRSMALQAATHPSHQDRLAAIRPGKASPDA